MKYLATTFAITFMAFGFVNITTTSAHSREGYDYSGGGHDCYNSEYGTECVSTSQITDVESLEQKEGSEETSVAGNSSERCEVDARNVKRCELIPADPSSIFADREDGKDGDVGGGDFGGDDDRAAASTSAE